MAYKQHWRIHMAETENSCFGGFTDTTEQFLWGVALNNERTWFNEHKQEYIDCLSDPLKLLAQEVCSKINKKFNLGLVPYVTRIYRDARRLHGRGPYKDKLWFSLRMPIEDWASKPIFYFEISNIGARYGMGCYYNRPFAMELFRKRVTADPSAFEELIEHIQSDNIFKLEGENKKHRLHAPTEKVAQWYQKKSIDICRRLKWGSSLKAKYLPKKLFEHFSTLVPVYNYFDAMSVEIAANDPKYKA